MKDFKINPTVQPCKTSDGFGVSVRQYESRYGQQMVDIEFRDQDERERHLFLDLGAAQDLGAHLKSLEPITR